MRTIKYIIPIIKYFIAFALTKTFCKNLKKKDIWVIGEKKTEARDNGYHLFTYVREKYPEINIFYILTKDSSDLNKLLRYENIILNSTIKHFKYFISANKVINSQLPNQNLTIPFYSKLIKMFPFLKDPNQHLIYLKHGIYKDEMSHNRDYDKTGFSIVSCATKREQEFIMSTYGYPKSNAKLLGLCRYDKLYSHIEEKSKQILVMPTFRKWLVSSNRTKRAENNEVIKFRQSEYYNVYLRLLESDKLKYLLEKYNYKLIFYPHYSMQSYIHLFENKINNTRISVANRFDYDVQKLLIDSQIMITDYSSVFFDFAYMKKPQIFFQFDQKAYRDNHYSKGYFSYERDGFGPVVHNIDYLLFNLENILKNDGEMKAKYQERVDGFFTLRDNNNCERTYRAIKSLSQ